MAGEVYSSESEFLVWFVEFPSIFWTECEGGSTSREQSEVFPGGVVPGTVTVEGPTSYEEVTVRAPFDPFTFAQLLTFVAAYDRGVKRKLTLVKQPVLADGTAIPGGKTTTWLRCSLKSFTEGSARKGSSEVQMAEMVVKPEEKL